ncbi:alcohol dehydrogenase catalytic domain-containing protein [Micrococcoides hystricis]|uniref:Alcohol dehydrogenase catalytic domain-containing protein n=1 Tax=Micrococcoides hystricis TaxID=1572761 RepID=A0ABV6PCG3_9MICC
MLAAVTTQKCTTELVTRERPAVPDGHVLVRVEYVSLCGTDLHIWEDDYASELPLIQGHEIAGTIVERGTDVAFEWTMGQRVVVSPMVFCGTCPACRVGRVNACQDMSVLGCYQDGALAEYISVPASKLYAIPDNLPTELAALSEPVSISMQAVNRARVESGEWVLLFGAGPIGLLAVLYLKELGANVVVVDLDPDRLALATEFGADLTFQSSGEFPTAEQRELLLAHVGQAGPTVVIEATGVPACVETAIDLVACAGRVVLVGISDRPVQISQRTLPVKELDLLGSRNSLLLQGDALGLIDRNQSKVSKLITHRFTLAELQKAFQTMADPDVFVGKIVIALETQEQG